MSRVHILRRISSKSCPYCLSSQVYFSRPKRWWEKTSVHIPASTGEMSQLYAPSLPAYHVRYPKPPATETVERKAPQIIPAEERQDRLA